MLSDLSFCHSPVKGDFRRSVGEHHLGLDLRAVGQHHSARPAPALCRDPLHLDQGAVRKRKRIFLSITDE